MRRVCLLSQEFWTFLARLFWLLGVVQLKQARPQFSFLDLRLCTKQKLTCIRAMWYDVAWLRRRALEGINRGNKRLARGPTSSQIVRCSGEKCLACVYTRSHSLILHSLISSWLRSGSTKAKVEPHALPTHKSTPLNPMASRYIMPWWPDGLTACRHAT